LSKTQNTTATGPWCPSRSQSPAALQRAQKNSAKMSTAHTHFQMGSRFTGAAYTLLAFGSLTTTASPALQAVEYSGTGRHPARHHGTRRHETDGGHIACHASAMAAWRGRRTQREGNPGCPSRSQSPAVLQRAQRTDDQVLGADRSTPLHRWKVAIGPSRPETLGGRGSPIASARPRCVVACAAPWRAVAPCRALGRSPPAGPCGPVWRARARRTRGLA